jgi:hypothetical protein
MKHLRKFNENTDNSIDVEYIKHCFTDLVEYSYNEDNECGEFRWGNSETLEEVTESGNPTDCRVFINCPELEVKFTADGYKGEISDFIEFNKITNEFLLKLEGAINNLKDEYPNYKVEVLYEQPLLRGHQGYDYYCVCISL